MKTSLDFTGEEFYHYPDEIPLLRLMAASCPRDAIIVNIGVGFGTSVLAFQEGNPTATIAAIDKGSFDEARKNWEAAGANLCSILCIQGDSQVMRFPWDADLVFVDGAHGRTDVERDILNWRSRAKRFMVFHDMGMAVCPDVEPTVIQHMGKPHFREGYIAVYEMEKWENGVKWIKHPGG